LQSFERSDGWHHLSDFSFAHMMKMEVQEDDEVLGRRLQPARELP
jgi:hypothetical protein